MVPRNTINHLMHLGVIFCASELFLKEATFNDPYFLGEEIM
jgi:hypothetical protein